MEELIADARRDMPGKDARILESGLRRGVGIHHGALPTSYRQAVEILFRAGHLRVRQ